MKTKKLLMQKKQLSGTYKKKYKGGATSENFLVEQSKKLKARITKLLKEIEIAQVNYTDAISDEIDVLTEASKMLDNVNTNNAQTLLKKSTHIEMLKKKLVSIKRMLMQKPINNDMTLIKKDYSLELITSGINLIDSFKSNIREKRLDNKMEAKHSASLHEERQQANIDNAKSARLQAKYANEHDHNAKSARLQAKYANEDENNAKSERITENISTARIAEKFTNANEHKEGVIGKQSRISEKIKNARLKNIYFTSKNNNYTEN